MANNLMEELKKPLDTSDIEFRVGTVGKGKSGFSLLAYKTARTDTLRLNNVCGVQWKNRFFYDDRKILCCGISVYDTDTKEWVERIDVGTDSNTEAEKGSYSDAFKRAGFKFGIGAELYDFPFIWISNWNAWNSYNGKDRPDFKPSYLSFGKYIIEKGVIKELVLLYKGKQVYTYKDNSTTIYPDSQAEPSTHQVQEQKKTELTEQEKKDIKLKEALDEYKLNIASLLTEQEELGLNKVAIVNSIKHHLKVDKLGNCGDINALSMYYLHCQNKITELKKGV